MSMVVVPNFAPKISLGAPLDSLGSPVKLGRIPPLPRAFGHHRAIGQPQNRGVVYLPSRGVGVARTLSLIPQKCTVSITLVRAAEPPTCARALPVHRPSCPCRLGQTNLRLSRFLINSTLGPLVPACASSAPSLHHSRLCSILTPTGGVRGPLRAPHDDITAAVSQSPSTLFPTHPITKGRRLLIKETTGLTRPAALTLLKAVAQTEGPHDKQPGHTKRWGGVGEILKCTSTHTHPCMRTLHTPYHPEPQLPPHAQDLSKQPQTPL